MEEAIDGGGQRGHTVVAVQDEIRTRILRRELLPGVQLRQEEMARSLGISRVPLREAFRVLANEGLLTHRPHQGYFVASMSQADLNQINVLLEFLETELIRTIRWPDDDEVAELRRVNGEFADAGRSGDIALVNDLNRDFHTKIFALSPLQVFRTEVERFWGLSEPYRLLHVASTDAEVAADQHEGIVDALAAQQRALCLRLTSEHRAATQAAARAMLKAFGSDLAGPIVD